ncbi:hypothetical protein AU468_10300 [Alkalispirochaeta sphaeroplastigenens]|uniref:Uncharacterized protein TP-0789 domain-containing protein n=1 Tax=Alkalispirochaeta sphaeroplastigenens TaxID=1187066 RepID=A0A2S4JJQ0_9SPIO|nr:outer membrane lipoprotein-sorting protein [Alkalispirochaeta sphaeroplastigenens]POQ99690.1 hypothetical protein AU468_10300 [Alkalispirochaeta sphaeroplastigenens]
MHRGEHSTLPSLLLRSPGALLLALTIFLPLPVSGETPQASYIISRMEENQTHPTSYLEGYIIITDRFGQRRSSYIAHTRGTDRFLLEFTSRNEAGQRVLRRDGDLYLYYPDARETIRLTGAALRDSLVGSDISYEDMTGGRGLSQDYDFTLLGEEEIHGRGTFKIELLARRPTVAYPRQIFWVDREYFVLRRSEQYARSGRILKVTEVLETRREGPYHFPSRLRITDQTRRSRGTELALTTVRIGIDLPGDIFSLDRLTW